MGTVISIVPVLLLKNLRHREVESRVQGAHSLDVAELGLEPSLALKPAPPTPLPYTVCAGLCESWFSDTS